MRNNFLSTFISIIGKIGSYDQEIQDEEKKKKILQTFLASFKPTATVYNIIEMTLNDIVNAMYADIERQQNVKNPSDSEQKVHSAQPQTYFKNFNRNRRGTGIGRGEGSFKGRISQGRGCQSGGSEGFSQILKARHYCHKFRHFIKNFSLSKQEE